MRVAANFALKTETCRVLLEIWSQARGTSMMPRRADVGPDLLKPILPQVAIVAVDSPGRNDIRLAGTAYRDIFGFEPTSRNLIHLTPSEIQRLRAYRFHMAATQPCGGLAVLRFVHTRGASDRFEFLALPLEADTPERPRMVICAIASMLGRQWRNEQSNEFIDGPAEQFQFLDIGAGIPSSTEPPADFAIEETGGA